MTAALHALAAPALVLPAYVPSGNECALFEHAWRHQLPVLLKGPTGCGKTRFVAHMAARLGLPLHTVACHDDLTAADLTGRYLLRGGDTVWTDGPLTRAVREGGICYLDEVVEARKDVTVVLHPLTDDRRILPLERTGEELVAPKSFMLVVSYNPGYQTLLKALKPSTRQRFVAVEFGFLAPEQEIAVVAAESGLAPDYVRPAGPAGRPAARAEGARPGGGRFDPSRGLLRHPDCGGSLNYGCGAGRHDRTAHR
ncbi:nitric oxide reductase NorQ protein [Bradyrhizobium sp. i1.3.6]